MPNYTLYRDDIKTIEPNEGETHQKIVDVLTKGQNITREKYGEAVRISHAKAHGFVKGDPHHSRRSSPRARAGPICHARDPSRSHPHGDRAGRVHR